MPALHFLLTRLLGGENETVHETTTNRKPNQSTEPLPSSLSLFSNHMRKVRKDHRAPTSDLENMEDTILIKKVLLFQVTG